MRSEWALSIQVPAWRIVWADKNGGRVRLVYHALPANFKHQKGLSPVFKIPEALRVCQIDLEKGAVIADQVVHEDVKQVAIGFNPNSAQLYLHTTSEVFVQARGDMSVKERTQSNLRPLFDEREFLLIGSMCIDSTGKFMGLVTNPLGELAVVSKESGRVVFQDDRHVRWVRRQLEGQSFPIAGLWMLIRDFRFLPGETTLVVLAGSGHVYHFDPQSGKLLRRGVLKQGLTD